MEKVRDGVIGVLTHKNKVIFMSLPEEDLLSKDAGGKEKRERTGADNEWTTLSTSMLGLVSGGVKEENLIGEFDYDEQEIVLFDNLRREAREEFDLNLDLTVAEIIRDGVVEQERRDDVITFFLWIVGKVVIDEAELERLMEKEKVVLVEEDNLEEFLIEQKNNIRPSAIQAIRTMYNL